MTMTPYNISIQKPDDEEQMFNNALQLQPHYTLGHRNSSSLYTDAHIATSGRAGYMYPHISTTSLINSEAYSFVPQATQLETVSPSYPTEMQGGQMPELDEAQRRYAAERIALAQAQSSLTQASPVLYGWSPASELPHPSTSSYFWNGSPISQGQSPVTPITPLSTVEPSPTMSLLPSPGSQGSNDALHLSPSSSQQPHILQTSPEHCGTFGQVQPAVCQHHHGSETQLTAPQTIPQALPQYTYYEDNATSPVVVSTVTRRHSHSAANTSHRGSPSSGFSPYPNPSSLPTRDSNLNTPFIDLPLISRKEYRFERWSLPGPVVPQTLYQPPTDSDRRRYVEEFTLQQPVYFERTDGPLIGITLIECVTQRFKNLVGHEDKLLQECGPSISIRLNWRGYERWSRQIPTRDFKCPPGPITRKQLAKNVAKTVQKFIDENINVPIKPDGDHRWQVGPGKIAFGDLVLLSMHHVSRGSWQANLCLNQPLEQVLAKSFTAQ